MFIVDDDEEQELLATKDRGDITSMKKKKKFSLPVLRH